MRANRCRMCRARDGLTANTTRKRADFILIAPLALLVICDDKRPAAPLRPPTPPALCPCHVNGDGHLATTSDDDGPTGTDRAPRLAPLTTQPAETRQGGPATRTYRWRRHGIRLQAQWRRAFCHPITGPVTARVMSSDYRPSDGKSAIVRLEAKWRREFWHPTIGPVTARVLSSDFKPSDGESSVIRLQAQWRREFCHPTTGPVTARVLSSDYRPSYGKSSVIRLQAQWRREFCHPTTGPVTARVLSSDYRPSDGESSVVERGTWPEKEHSHFDVDSRLALKPSVAVELLHNVHASSMSTERYLCAVTR